MIGTIVNTLAIVGGSVFGALLRKGIKPEWQMALFNAMGFCALGLGANAFVQNIGKSTYPVLFIVSLAVGSLVGYGLKLTERFNQLLKMFDRNQPSKNENVSSSDGSSSRSTCENRLAEGLITGILLYCVGTLSMLGPVLSALQNDNTYLYTNATLDFVTSAVLASTYGIGMIWAAPVLFCWQGFFYLVAQSTSDFINSGLIVELSIVGGVLIMASGFSLLRLKDFKPLNMLPSLLVPILYFALKYLLF